MHFLALDLETVKSFYIIYFVQFFKWTNSLVNYKFSTTLERIFVVINTGICNIEVEKWDTDELDCQNHHNCILCQLFLLNDKPLMKYWQ